MNLKAGLPSGTGVVTDDVKKTVDEIIAHVGKDIKFGMTLALGKPILLINELYKRAKEDPEIKLDIVTALALEKPRGHSELEKRFLRPLADRIFEGTPEFDYMLDFRAGKLPKNVAVYEFFNKAGGYLHTPEAQQNHLCSNYTHVVRDAINFGVNVLGLLVGCREINGKMMYSLGCNTDITIGAMAELKKKRAKGEKVAVVAEVNKNMPFMYGDAIFDGSEVDILLTGPQYDYPLFGPPKDAVPLRDHMIGLHVSTLIKDGGTIQVGIGSLGDAIVSGLVMRNDHHDIYQEVLEKAGITKRYEKLIKEYGDTGHFNKGLYGSSEMFVDAFMQMYKKGILKRKVFDSIPLMKLINAEKLDPENIPSNIIEMLLEMKAIHYKLNEEDFKFLCDFGILKAGLSFNGDHIDDNGTKYSCDLSDSKNLSEIKKLLGKKLHGGKVILGAFFIGPRAFYNALNEMSEEERSQFGMSGVEKVNQLYGGEELRALQRKDGRFVNAGMIANVFGAVASDQLEDGRVISGIGGQYNFVSMAHALPDGRLIMMIRSTRGTGKTLKSNIVFKYGHCSVPKHLRDIIVTEYGIADLRGKPDKDVIMEMIKVADSRFQDELLKQAKAAGKVPAHYEIPPEYRNNYPEKYESILKPYQAQGYFQPFPFGTDLTENEIALGGSLKAMKALATGHPLKLVSGLFLELFRPIPKQAAKYLEMMELAKPSSVKERILRKMVVFALRNHKEL